MALEPPAFDLSAPGSVIYDGWLAAQGLRITRFGQGFKAAANRAAYRADPDGYLARADLTEEERARIKARDYTWLIRQGGHIQALQRIAAVDGYDLFHIAAHDLGVDPQELIAACPRRVSGVGMANEDLDRLFLARLKDRAEELVAIPQEELMRLGGTEAAELSLWFAMRGALSAQPREVHAYYTFPKITGCGVIAFEETT